MDISSRSSYFDRAHPFDRLALGCGSPESVRLRARPGKSSLEQEQELVAPFLASWFAEGPRPTSTPRSKTCRPNNSVAGAIQKSSFPISARTPHLLCRRCQRRHLAHDQRRHREPFLDAPHRLSPSLSDGAMARDLDDTTANTLLRVSGFSARFSKTAARARVCFSPATPLRRHRLHRARRTVGSELRPADSGRAEHQRRRDSRQHASRGFELYLAISPGPGRGSFAARTAATTFTQVLGQIPRLLSHHRSGCRSQANLEIDITSARFRGLPQRRRRRDLDQRFRTTTPISWRVRAARSGEARGRARRPGLRRRRQGRLLFIAFTADQGSALDAHGPACARRPSWADLPTEPTPTKVDKLQVHTFGPLVAPGEPRRKRTTSRRARVLALCHYRRSGQFDLVYVGGDRQPLPSFIGATNFSGRLFRGNAAIAPTGAVPSPQWAHLTNSNAIPEIPSVERPATARLTPTREAWRSTPRVTSSTPTTAASPSGRFRRTTRGIGSASSAICKSPSCTTPRSTPTAPRSMAARKTPGRPSSSRTPAAPGATTARATAAMRRSTRLRGPAFRSAT